MFCGQTVVQLWTLEENILTVERNSSNYYGVLGQYCNWEKFVETEAVKQFSIRQSTEATFSNNRLCNFE